MSFHLIFMTNNNWAISDEETEVQMSSSREEFTTCRK